MQQKETHNSTGLEEFTLLTERGRIVSIDLGTKRVGVAVSDEGMMICRPLHVLKRSSWKKLLSSIQSVLHEFDAKALVIGLPLESDGAESPMSLEAREVARKFALSLQIPVYLQDERSTSYAAKGKLWAEKGPKDLRGRVDSEAAAMILSDFLDRLPKRNS